MKLILAACGGFDPDDQATWPRPRRHIYARDDKTGEVIWFDIRPMTEEVRKGIEKKHTTQRRERHPITKEWIDIPEVNNDAVEADLREYMLAGFGGPIYVEDRHGNRRRLEPDKAGRETVLNVDEIRREVFQEARKLNFDVLDTEAAEGKNSQTSDAGISAAVRGDVNGA